MPYYSYIINSNPPYNNPWRFSTCSRSPLKCARTSSSRNRQSTSSSKSAASSRFLCRRCMPRYGCSIATQSSWATTTSTGFCTRAGPSSSAASSWSAWGTVRILEECRKILRRRKKLPQPRNKIRQKIFSHSILNIPILSTLQYPLNLLSTQPQNPNPKSKYQIHQQV